MSPDEHWSKNAAVVGIAYAAAFLLWVFAVVGPLDKAGSNALLPMIVFAAINVGFGLFVRRWWVAALAVLIPVIAAPIGDEGFGDGTVFGLALFLAGIAAVFLLIGVAIGRGLDHV